MDTKIITLAAAFSLTIMTACTPQKPLSRDFGNATQQNKAVQVANPEVSNKAPTYDGAHTAAAVGRYRVGRVEEVKVESTSEQ